MRSDELFARDVFDSLLSRAGETDVSWNPGADPPDFNLTVGERLFDVEVTQLMESFDVGHGSIPYAGASAAMIRLAESIEARARAAGHSGKYVLNMSPIPNLRSRAEAISAAALRYITQTQQGLADADEFALYDDSMGAHIRIERAADGDLAVYWMFGGPDAKSGGKVAKELSHLLQDRIRDKATRARSEAPAVLLIVDRYYYAPGNDWQATVNAIAQHPFHTIARVCHDETCQVLHSETPNWRSAPPAGRPNKR